MAHIWHTLNGIFRKRQINENDGKKMRKINIYTECGKAAAAFQQPNDKIKNNKNHQNELKDEIFQKRFFVEEISFRLSV